MIEDGWLYFEINKGMDGIPEAGRLANDLLRQRLKEYGYYECTHTPRYRRHLWKPTSWTLIVDDFGIKYTNKKDIDELLGIMEIVQDENRLGWFEFRGNRLGVELPRRVMG